MNKCTEGSGDKCLYAKEPKCRCECNGKNHGRQLEMFTEKEGGENMTYRLTIADEEMLKKALTQLMVDVQNCWQDQEEKDLDKYSVPIVVKEIVDIFKEFGK